jgi:hypothetical protein
MADLSKLTVKQRETLRHMNEKATGPVLLPCNAATPLRNLGLVEKVGTGRPGRTLVGLTDAGLRAANELVGGSAAA